MSVKHNSAVATVRAHAPRVGSSGPQCATAHEHDCASKRPDYSKVSGPHGVDFWFEPVQCMPLEACKVSLHTRT